MINFSFLFFNKNIDNFLQIIKKKIFNKINSLKNCKFYNKKLIVK